MSTKTHIIYSQPAIRIVTEPFLFGDELLELATQAGRDFLHAAVKTEGLQSIADASKLTILNILNGGKYYALEQAWKREFTVAAESTKQQATPCVSQLRAKRYLDQTSNQFMVRTWDRSGEINGQILLIGDTLATGATLSGVLMTLIDEQIAQGKTKLPFESVVVWTLAGARQALTRLEAVAQRLKELGSQLHVFYANAMFNLDESNGTDLGFVGATYDEKARHAIEQRISSEFLPHMKCCIWDWGDRFTNPKHHIKEIEEYYLETEPSRHAVPLYIREGIAAAKDLLAAKEEETKQKHLSV